MRIGPSHSHFASGLRRVKVPRGFPEALELSRQVFKISPKGKFFDYLLPDRQESLTKLKPEIEDLSLALKFRLGELAERDKLKLYHDHLKFLGNLRRSIEAFSPDTAGDTLQLLREARDRYSHDSNDPMAPLFRSLSQDLDDLLKGPARGIWGQAKDFMTRNIQFQKKLLLPVYLEEKEYRPTPAQMAEFKQKTGPLLQALTKEFAEVKEYTQTLKKKHRYDERVIELTELIEGHRAEYHHTKYQVLRKLNQDYRRDLVEPSIKESLARLEAWQADSSLDPDARLKGLQAIQIELIDLREKQAKLKKIEGLLEPETNHVIGPTEIDLMLKDLQTRIDEHLLSINSLGQIRHEQTQKMEAGLHPLEETHNDLERKIQELELGMTLDPESRSIKQLEQDIDTDQERVAALERLLAFRIKKDQDEIRFLQISKFNGSARFRGEQLKVYQELQDLTIESVRKERRAEREEIQRNKEAISENITRSRARLAEERENLLLREKNQKLLLEYQSELEANQKAAQSIYQEYQLKLEEIDRTIEARQGLIADLTSQAEEWSVLKKYPPLPAELDLSDLTGRMENLESRSAELDGNLANLKNQVAERVSYTETNLVNHLKRIERNSQARNSGLTRQVVTEVQQIVDDGGQQTLKVIEEAQNRADKAAEEAQKAISKAQQAEEKTQKLTGKIGWTQTFGAGGLLTGIGGLGLALWQYVQRQTPFLGALTGSQLPVGTALMGMSGNNTKTGTTSPNTPQPSGGLSGLSPLPVFAPG